MLEAVLFYIFAGLAVLGAIAVVSFRSPVRSTLSLLVSMFSLAVLFLTLQATFVAFIHIAVYAGAVVILFLFVIMLIGIKEKEKARPRPPFLAAALLAVLFLVFLAGKAVLAIISANSGSASQSAVGSAQALSALLFSEYLLPFELISILMLTAIIGAVYLGTRRET
jgi:NADH-quinone oxidoreductase subunit J